MEQNDGAGSTIDDAFSSTGLPRLPVRESGQRDGQGMNNKFGDIYGSGRGKQLNVPDKGKVHTNRDHHSVQPPETALLRDLPFTLQGLSSTNLQFMSASALTLPPTLPLPLISLLHTLAEPSLLYRGLSEFIQSSEGGLIGQSLKAAIGQELRSYLGLVATLEGEIRRALASLGAGEPGGGVGKAGVTLKRCVVWTREATMGLRLMSLMVEESKSCYLWGPEIYRNLLTVHRQKRGSVDINDSWVLIITWRPVRRCICGATAIFCDTTILRYVTSVDLRRRIVRSLS